MSPREGHYYREVRATFHLGALYRCIDANDRKHFGKFFEIVRLSDFYVYVKEEGHADDDTIGYYPDAFVEPRPFFVPISVAERLARAADEPAPTKKPRKKRKS